MSPSASWAKSVMPTRTEDSASPGLRTHSCSLVYFRSSGNTALLCLGWLVDGWSMAGRWAVGGTALTRRGRLSGRPRLGVLRSRRLADAGDPDVAEPLDVDLAAHALHVGDEPSGEVECGGQRVRVADGLDDVRRLEPGAVDDHTASCRILQRGLGDHPDAVVDLDHLGARVPQLLEAVEELVGADSAAGVGDGYPDSGALRRPCAGEDPERLRLLAGSFERRTACLGVVAEGGPGLLQRGDLAVRSLRGERQVVDELDEVGLTRADEAVVPVVGLHLGHRREAEHREQHGCDDLPA